MNQTNVGNENQEAEAGPLLTPARGAMLSLGSVERRPIISSPTGEPQEAPTMNPHLLSDAEIQSLQQGDALPPARDAGSAFRDAEGCVRGAVRRLGDQRRAGQCDR